MWKRIHYGAYEINKSGTVRRVKKAPGTRPGKVLKPYKRWRVVDWTVKLHYNGKISQVTIPVLLKRAFGF